MQHRDATDARINSARVRVQGRNADFDRILAAVAHSIIRRRFGDEALTSPPAHSDTNASNRDDPSAAPDPSEQGGFALGACRCDPTGNRLELHPAGVVAPRGAAPPRQHGAEPAAPTARYWPRLHRKGDGSHGGITASREEREGPRRRVSSFLFKIRRLGPRPPREKPPEVRRGGRALPRVSGGVGTRR